MLVELSHKSVKPPELRLTFCEMMGCGVFQQPARVCSEKDRLFSWKKIAIDLLRHGELRMGLRSGIEEPGGVRIITVGGKRIDIDDRGFWMPVRIQFRDSCICDACSGELILEADRDDLVIQND